MGKHKSLDYKQSVLEYYHRTNSFQQTCDPFGCKKTTLWRWIRKEREGDLPNRKRNGSYKVTEEHVDSMTSKIKEDPDTTLAQLQELIMKEYGVSLSLMHIARVIRDNNYTLKVKNRKHFPETYRNVPRNKAQEVSQFMSEIKKHPLDKIISIDETSVVAGMSRNRGREFIGKRLVEMTSHPDRFKKKTVVMGISADGVEGWTMYDKGGMTSERMVAFLQKVLKDKVGYVVVMDNASTHGTKEVRNIIQQTGNKLLHSIPYSPETNNIEEFFNQFKHYIRRQNPQNIEELKTAIQYSLKEIKKRGCCRNYFVHAYEGEKTKIRKPRTRPAKKYKAD